MTSDSTTNPHDQLIWAMQIWATCPTLDGLEHQMVKAFLKNAEDSFDAFMNAKAYFVQAFPLVLRSAINKARAAGLVQTWPTEAA